MSLAPWIKICGITSAAALTAALEAGVDAIGFVFAPSVRRIQPLEANKLVEPARGRCAVVAVTLHPEQQWIDEIVRELRPDCLQTDLADIGALRLPSSLAVLPVLRGAAPGPLPERVLFEGAISGSGLSSDWSQAESLARRTELILAGGLNCTNVAAAIRAVRPFGVDVSSGVEASPGSKSPQMIGEFVAAARAAARSAYERD